MAEQKVSSILFTVCFFLFVYSIPIAELYSSYLQTKMYEEAISQKYNLDRFIGIISSLLRHGLINPGGISAFILLFWIWIKPSRLAYVSSAILSAPIIYLAIRGRMGGFGLNGFPVFIGFFGVIFMWFLRKETTTKILFFLIWLPSLVAALSLAFWSANRTQQASIGIMPGAIICLVCFQRLIITIFKKEKITISPKKIILLFLFQLGAILLYLDWKVIYIEDKLSMLTTKVEKGPFRWLRTSHIKADFLNKIFEDIQTFQKPGGRILFYPHFPAGYLMSSMRPATPTVWGCLGIPDVLCADYFIKKINNQSIAFLSKSSIAIIVI